MREIHHFNHKFESITEIKTKLVEQFKEQVSESDNTNIGYFDGSSKLCLVNSDDLKSLYAKYPSGGSIVLWCDGRFGDVSNITAVSEKKQMKIQDSLKKKKLMLYLKI